MIEDIITKKIYLSLKDDFAVSESDINLLTPPSSGLGDFSLSTAMKLSKRLKQNPSGIAKRMQKKLETEEIFKEVRIAKPGFVNLFLADDFILEQTKQILELGTDYGKNENFKGQNVLVEFTDPNPFKILHIGHLFTNIVGESLARLYEASGATVKRANYQGDVGLHVGKTLYGIKEKLKTEDISWETVEKMELRDRVDWLGQAYVYGTQQFEENEMAREEIYNLNRYAFVIAQEEFSDNIVVNFRSLGSIDEDELSEIRKYYLEGRQWCLDYFERIYKRLNAHFDFYFFESVTTDYGMRAVMEALSKGVLEKDGKSVIFRGEKYGLHTRVFINKLGLPTYEAKDLGLAILKYKKFKYDKSIIITGSEQAGYFKVVLKVLDLLYPELADATMHLSHGMVKLPGAKKMSSRKGNVLSAEWLIDSVVEKVLSIVSERDLSEKDKKEIAEKVGVGALKYAFLHNSIGGDIVFDIDKVTKFNGDTGAYVMYALVRARSILNKIGGPSGPISFGHFGTLDVATANVLKLSLHFPAVVANATDSLEPSFVISYLYKLAENFNAFYASNKVLTANSVSDKIKNTFTVQVVSQVLENGLKLLNIPIVEKM